MSTRRKLIATASAVLVVIALAVGVPLRYEAGKQATMEAAFYYYSLDMRVAYDADMPYPFHVSEKGFWATLFTRVEYVMELPPDNRRQWAVIYIIPYNRYYMLGDRNVVFGTQRQVDDLNEIIAADPGIVVGENLILPLTEEQVIAEPKAVVEIIKQLDKEQWDHFYRGRFMPVVEERARAIGIEQPVE